MMFKKVKKFIPPILWDFGNIFKRNQIKFIFGFDSWSACQKKAKGYDDDEIIQKVRLATHDVATKKAKYERDSVLFSDNHQLWYLISLLALKKLENIELGLSLISVVDYGGALGSLYFQHIDLIDKIGGVEWNIVEQQKYVEIGKKEFQNSELKFHENIDDINQFDIVIFSAVLQYLENPYSALENLLRSKPDYVIIDRLFISELEGHDVLSLQKNPKSFVMSNYPCWIFSKRKFCNFIALCGYKVFSDMEGIDSFRNGMKSHCFIIKRDIKND